MNLFFLSEFSSSPSLILCHYNIRHNISPSFIIKSLFDWSWFSLLSSQPYFLGKGGVIFYELNEA